MDTENILGICLAAIVVIVGVIIIFNVATAGQTMNVSTETVSQTLYTKDLNIGQTGLDIQPATDGNRFIAQTFVAAGNILDTTDLNIGKNAATTKDLNVSLYQTTAGKPTTKIVTKILSKTAGKPTISRLTWSQPVTKGTTYAIVYDYNDSFVGGGIDQNYWVTSVKTGNPLANSTLLASTNGTLWYEIDGNTTDTFLVASFSNIPGWDVGTVAMVGIITIVLAAGLVIYAVRKMGEM